MNESPVRTRKITLTLDDDEHLRLLVLLKQNAEGRIGKGLNRRVDVVALHDRLLNAWFYGVPA